MQFAKDSFYMALRTRLATLNPQRTVTIDGVVRPAVVVLENQPATAAVIPLETFTLSFGVVRPVESTQTSSRPLLSLACGIAYRTAGTDANLNTDRGRTLAELDLELLQIFSPPWVEKQDYTQTPPADLGSKVTWLQPELGKVEVAGNELLRSAQTTLFFHPEVNF